VVLVWPGNDQVVDGDGETRVVEVAYQGWMVLGETGGGRVVPGGRRVVIWAAQ